MLPPCSRMSGRAAPPRAWSEYAERRIARPNELRMTSAPSSCARRATENAVEASFRTPVTKMRLPSSSMDARSGHRSEDQRSVVSTEAERVRDRRSGTHVPRATADHVDADVVADAFEVRGGRHLAASDREDGGHGLGRAGRADEMSGDALDGGDRGGVVAEDLADRLRFGRVIERGRRPVRVHMSDLGRVEAGVIERELHACSRAIATRGGPVSYTHLRAHETDSYLGVDGRATGES